MQSVSFLLARCTTVTTVGLLQTKRAFTLASMNLSEEQLTRHAQNVVRKQDRIDTLQALLATHEAMGAEPDSPDVTDLKERLKSARTQLAYMR